MGHIAKVKPVKGDPDIDEEMAFGGGSFKRRPFSSLQKTGTQKANWDFIEDDGGKKKPARKQRKPMKGPLRNDNGTPMDKSKAAMIDDIVMPPRENGDGRNSELMIQPKRSMRKKQVNKLAKVNDPLVLESVEDFETLPKV